MAKKGGSRHLKRYAASRALKLPRKSFTWTTKAASGPHPSKGAIPLRLLLRDYLSVGHKGRVIDNILSKGNVLVDGKVRREPKFPVGIMDVVQLPALGRSYRVLLDHRKRLIASEINQSEASVKLCEVARKQIVRGGKVQLTFHDGKTLVGDLNEFKPRDVAKLALPDLKVLERFPFEVGAMALITGGTNVGKIGRISEIKRITSAQPNIVILKTDGEELQAPEDYVFVVGKKKPSITLPGVR
ncbi:MAG: 30S ribosomal protein S4e [Hadesarchaea archaeon]|nr:30S ribosomal protein S4e [Hadesarchaea archaeon]